MTPEKLHCLNALKKFKHISKDLLQITFFVGARLTGKVIMIVSLVLRSYFEKKNTLYLCIVSAGTILCKT